MPSKLFVSERSRFIKYLDRQKRWRQSPSGKASIKARRRRHYLKHTDREKARRAKWYRRPEVIERYKSRRKDPEFQQRSRAAVAKYRKSDRWKQIEKKYRNRPDVKLKQRELARIARQAPHRKAHRRQYNSEYAKTLNGKIALRRKHLKRRALKAGSSVGDLKIIDRWIDKWKSKKSVRCYYCGKKLPPDKCHVDHIIALSKGGSHSIENLCIACEFCNCSKHSTDLAEWNSRIVSPVLL